MGRNRVSLPGFKGERGIEKLKELRFLIMQLDGMRATRRIEPAIVELSFQELNLTSMWQKIENDANKIAYLPHTIPRMKKLINLVGFLKGLFPVCFFSIVLSVFIKAGIFPEPNDLIFPALLIIPTLIMIAFICMDFLIRIKIIRYEQKHPDLYHQEGENIKRVVEALLIKMSKAIKSMGENGSKYRFKLYFNDYRGIRIVKEKNEKVFGIFRRKYVRYMVSPI